MSDVRAQLALKTCDEARLHGYDLIVVDGSPCKEFKDELRARGANVIDQKEKGMGGSRRECLKAGIETGSGVIVWLEPEKHPLVSLLEPCIELVLSGNADLVIPRRKSLAGYPHYQQWSELTANHALGNITGHPEIDFFIGPRVLSQYSAKVMSEYNQYGDSPYGDNWEILFIPIIWLLGTGKKVETVVVDYVHPKEQMIEDDEVMRAKRDKQRDDLVSAMKAEAEGFEIKGL